MCTVTLFGQETFTNAESIVTFQHYFTWLLEPGVNLTWTESAQEPKSRFSVKPCTDMAIRHHGPGGSKNRGSTVATETLQPPSRCPILYATVPKKLDHLTASNIFFWKTVLLFGTALISWCLWLQEFDFLFSADPEIDSSILTYYITELTRAIKTNLSCLVWNIGCPSLCGIINFAFRQREFEIHRIG